MASRDYHVLIQAREGSTRLPAKILKPLLLGYSLISSVMLRFSPLHCTILTGSEVKNQRLASHALTLGYQVNFGSETNVFQRFADFARNSSVQYLVRVTGDNPFVYVDCIDEMIDLMSLNDLDYCISKNIPIGCALEVLKRESLLELENLGVDEFTKEHVTPKFYSPNSSWKWLKYSCHFSSIASLRLTIDTQEDLSLAQNICKYFNREARKIYLFEIEELYRENPDFFKINQFIHQKSFRELE